MKVHPVYDAEACVWFCDDHPAEARSLRELAKLLPPRTTIVGYHPGGFGSNKPPPPAAPPEPDKPLPEPDRPLPEPGGMCPPAPKKAKQRPPAPKKAKQRPPAPKKAKMRRAPKKAQDLDLRNREILRLHNSGLSFGSVAKVLGVTNGTVAGVVWRARKEKIKKPGAP